MFNSTLYLDTILLSLHNSLHNLHSLKLFRTHRFVEKGLKKKYERVMTKNYTQFDYT